METKEQKKEELKEKLSNLINSFPKHADHNEENLKFNYIEPLLMETLGWNREDIVKEQRVLKGRADYILKIGNEEVLVIETKRPNVSLNEEEGRQAVSYAYHRKIKFAVLTNFKEIKVYHALSNIKNIDKNLLKFEDGGLFRIQLDQFLNNIDKLLLLSKDSFEKGEINKLLSKKDERLAKAIDESILDDLLEIRRKLSSDLKHLRMHLTQEQIDEAVQILIDRLIFMRSVEDRGLEPMNFLLGIRKDYREGRLRKRLWDEFIILFKKFDEEYNSKLFATSILEDETIFFSDDILQKVIYNLYFGTNEDQIRYKFDEIPGDLLGSIYEQYLGTVLQGTEKRVKLESESGKRKKMGIYYTPSYIVDYIVKHTVGEYIKNKTIDEILEVKILDPACGSGSFLTRAFQEVANVIEEKLKNNEKSKKYQSFQSHNGRLTLGQKATILENCIHGVDLDEKAIELAQLNLLLKLLEEETPETKKRILPNMKDNIKNGNSLIDDPKVAGDKAFNWHAQFPDIFRNGGFDVVIGNPPYGADLKDEDKKYIDEKFMSKTKDTAAYFLERASLLSKHNFGFIVPKSVAFYSGWSSIREYLFKENNLINVLDVGIGFKDANYEEIVICFDKKSLVKSIPIFVAEPIKKYKEVKKIQFKGYVPSEFVKIANVIIFSAINQEESKIIKKIISNSHFLGELCKDSFRGLYIPDKEKEKLKKGKDLFINKVPDISRYYINKIKEINISHNKNWLEKAKKIKVPRIFFKVLRGKRIVVYPDIEGKYLTTEKLVNFILKNEIQENISYPALAAIINSIIPSFFIEKILFSMTTETSRVMDLIYSKYIPIPKNIDKKQEKHIIELVDQMLSLQKKLHEKNLSGNEKERLEQQIKNIDYEIDQEVYKLYGLTKEEIKIVEESLK